MGRPRGHVRELTFRGRHCIKCKKEKKSLNNFLIYCVTARCARVARGGMALCDALSANSFFPSCARRSKALCPFEYFCPRATSHNSEVFRDLRHRLHTTASSFLRRPCIMQWPCTVTRAFPLALFWSRHRFSPNACIFAPPCFYLAAELN
jgi:hypothetical protein